MINWIQQMLLRRKKTDKGRMTLRKVQEEYGENDVCMGEQRWGTGRIVNNNRIMKTRKNGQI